MIFSGICSSFYFHLDNHYEVTCAILFREFKHELFMGNKLYRLGIIKDNALRKMDHIHIYMIK